MTTPTTTTFADMLDAVEANIRKSTEGVVCMGRWGVDLPTAITTGASANLIALPTGWNSAGLLDDGTGATWSRKPDIANVTSWGFAQPTRVDIKSDQRGLKFVMQEGKKQNIELYEGIDLSSITPDATTGEVVFDSPQRPDVLFWSVFAMFVDGEGADTCYVARLLSKASVSDLDDVPWDGGDDPVQYGVTLDALYDSQAGFAVRTFYGGPGFKARAADLGWSS